MNSLTVCLGSLFFARGSVLLGALCFRYLLLSPLDSSLNTAHLGLERFVNSRGSALAYCHTPNVRTLKSEIPRDPAEQAGLQFQSIYIGVDHLP
jgi:hypothetical protein